jgi:hypothetical protein
VINYGGCGVLSATIKERVTSPLGITGVTMRYGAVKASTNAVVNWIPQSMVLENGVWTGTISTTGAIHGDLSGSPVHVWVYFVATNGPGVQTQSGTYKNLLDVKYCAIH